jgi:hypothetical protein
MMFGSGETIFTDLKRCFGHSFRYRGAKLATEGEDPAVTNSSESEWSGAKIEGDKLAAALIYTAAMTMPRKPTTVTHFVLCDSMSFLKGGGVTEGFCRLCRGPNIEFTMSRGPKWGPGLPPAPRSVG